MIIAAGSQANNTEAGFCYFIDLLNNHFD